MTIYKRNSRVGPGQVLFCVLLWMTLFALPASGSQDPLILKEQIRVHGKVVTLGDLFENTGSAHSIAVFRSPDLGTEGFVTARRVKQAAARHGLDWANLGEIEQIVVRRPARTIRVNEMERAVRQELANVMGVDDISMIKIDLTGNPKPRKIDARITAPLVAKSVDYSAHADRFTALLAFEDAKQSSKTYRIHGRVFEAVETMVPARIINRGETIKADDVRMVQVQKSQLVSGRPMLQDDIVGMAAKRRLGAGRQIRRTDIEPPRMVRRNDLVTIIYRVRGLMLQAQGRALADGAKGGTISVRNTRSNQTIQAIVDGPDKVIVVGTAGRVVTGRPTSRRQQTAAANRTTR